MHRLGRQWLADGSRHPGGQERRLPRALLLPLALIAALAGCVAGGEEALAPVSVDPQAHRPQPPELPFGVRIVGMDSGEVARLLGEPALQRRERPAQYWRYSYAGCTLDLFLYAEPETGRMQVLHWELRAEPRPQAFRTERCAGMAARLGPLPGQDDLPEVASH
ncbi:MAG TPA: hypothetical protein VFG43_02300 [Geminicoccaceae bacterium]|nr:hypothetical protein [Geminicoccaceae bacterium]